MKFPVKGLALDMAWALMEADKIIRSAIEGERPCARDVELYFYRMDCMLRRCGLHELINEEALGYMIDPPDPESAE